MRYPFNRFDLSSSSIVIGAFIALVSAAPGEILAGELQYLQRATESTGIRGVTRLVTSPDGTDLYLSGDDETLAHYRIDESTGAVDFVHLYYDGVAGFHGLLDFNTMTISPTGEHLYLSSGDNTGELVTLARAADGSLTCLGEFSDPLGLAVDPLFWRTASSPDGQHLFAVGSNGDFPDDELAIFTFSQSAADEPVTLISVFSAGRAERNADRWLARIFVAVSPDGAHVVTGNFQDDAVGSFSRDIATGELTLVDTIESGDPGVSGLGDIVDLKMSPDGTDIYVASGIGDWRAQIRLDPSTGDLEFVDAFQTTPGSFVIDDWRPLAFSDDGRHAYCCVQGIGGGGGIEAYRRDETTGRLTMFAYLQSANHYYECTDMTLNPTGSWLYTLGHSNDYLVTYRRYDTSGLLLFDNQTRGENPYSEGYSGAATPQMDPLETRLFIPEMGAAQIVVLQRDPSDGTVAPFTVFTNGENGFDGSPAPKGIAFSRDGEYAYVSNCGLWPTEGDETIAVYGYDAQSGELTLIQVIDAEYAPHSLCWGVAMLTVEDPTFVYAFWESFAVTYQRDAQSGELTEIDRLELADLRLRSPVAAGVQDSSVYAGDYNDPGGIVAFLRDPVSGLLSYDETMDQSSCSVGFGNPLRYTTALAVGPEDAYLWELGGRHVIQTFDRDPASGSLTFSNCDEWATVGIAPHPILHRLATVYDLGSGSSLRWIGFDPTSGHPDLMEQHWAYNATVKAPAVSSDGKNVYAPYGWNGLGVFLVTPIFHDGFESGDHSVWAEASP